jgi:dTDP-4-amino-4,6-dideoxygalactose transaminase
VIPILNLTRQYQQLQPQLEQALLSAAQSGQYILGPNVQAFEQEMAQWLAPDHPSLQVVGCANGSDALYLALKALDIGPGDEVITTPMTYIATSEAIVRAGALPVFVDIDARTYNLSTQQLALALTPRTKAILPVHIFGLPANMQAIMQFAKANGLAIIEDCAQAIGAQHQGQAVGTLGDIGCFSFFPSKNLGAFGDGGMVTTKDPALADKLRMLRVHGSKQRYIHDLPGINSRLDDLQAAVLRVKLPHLQGWNQRRRELAARYNELLSPLVAQGLLACPLLANDTMPEALPVFHQYTLSLSVPAVAVGQGQAFGAYRDAVVAQLAQSGVQAMVYYPIPLYRQPTHSNLGLNPAQFPVCDAMAQAVLSLPMFPELTDDEQQHVAKALTTCLHATAQPV